MSTASHLLANDEVLCFLHIPKTAGLSLTDFLKSQFAPSESNSTTDFSDFAKTPPEEIAKYKFVTGHFPYSIGNLVKRKLVYITMLRDPVERTISHYAHIRRNPAHHGYEAAKSQSLLEFARDPRAQILYANLQARLIAVDSMLAGETAKRGNQLDPPDELDQAGDFYSPNGSLDAALLQRAQDRLSTFAFVGITERFDESLELLCAIFGWKMPAASKIINFGSNRPHDNEVSQEAIDVIRENNKVDTALYEASKRAFVERYNQLVSKDGSKASLTMDLNHDSIEALHRKIDLLQRANDQLGEELRQIQNSFGGRIYLGMNSARRKLMPHGSALETLYLKLGGR